MELRSTTWAEVMSMPYEFFIDDLKWKSKLESDKSKRIEDERNRSKADSRANKLRRRR